MIEAFDWSVAMTVSDQGGLSLGRAMMSWCGFLNQVTMRSDLVLVLIQLRDYCSLRQREVGHGSFPTALVLQPPPSHLGHTRWLSLSLSSPTHPWQISASPAPTSPHDRSGRPNITLQERLKPQWFEQVREVSHIFYPLPTHPDFRHRCRSDLQRDSRATLVHPQATRGSREGCTRCPLRP